MLVFGGVVPSRVDLSMRNFFQTSRQFEDPTGTGTTLGLLFASGQVGEIRIPKQKWFAGEAKKSGFMPLL